MYAIDNFSFTITATTLSTKQNEISGLSMYPNPVKDGYLYLTSDSSSAKSVVIFDLLGKEVLSATTSNNTVNVAGLTGGTYIVKITEDGKTASKKLLIQ
jgi:tRNA A22 N-methylase